MTRSTTCNVSHPRLGFAKLLLTACIAFTLVGCDSNPGGPTSPPATSDSTIAIDAEKGTPAKRGDKRDAPVSDR